MSRALCMMLAGAAALLSQPVLADDAWEAEARALFAEGHQQVAAGDYSGALARFQHAYALLPNPKILLNIGTMLRQLGREVEAANIYAQYLADPGADPKRRAEVESLIQDLDTRLARLDIDIRETGGRVLLDGEPVGQPGKRVTLRVVPGAHAVSIERPDASPESQQVDLAAGGRRDLIMSPLTPAASHPPPGATIAPQNATVIPELRPVASTKVKPPRADEALVASAPSVNTLAPEKPKESAEGRSHAGQLGGIIRGDVYTNGFGVVPMVGVSYGLGDTVELGIGALLPSASVGVEPNMIVYFGRGAIKPLASVGLPVVIRNEPYPGFRGSVGLQYDISNHFGIFGQVGVVLFPDTPKSYDRVVLLPSVGVQPRL